MSWYQDKIYEVAWQEFDCLIARDLQTPCNSCRLHDVPMFIISVRSGDAWEPWGVLCMGCMCSVMAAGGRPAEYVDVPIDPAETDEEW